MPAEPTNKPEIAEISASSDFDTMSAPVFGAGLRGMGVNILVRDIQEQTQRLKMVFGMTAHQITRDFAIMVYGSAIFQLHSDGTYHANPYLALLPENPPRGAGIELRLYDSDPDSAAQIGEAHGFTILQPPTDKPHGLRECYLLCPDGYAWVPSRPL